MNNLKRIAIAWNIMWGLAYIVAAFIAPNISLDTPAIVYGIFGAFILFCLLLQHRFGGFIIRVLWFALGAIEVFGGVASWTGYGLWNIPFPNKELFQVSMAFADLISAVFMFILATESDLSKQ